MSNYTLYCGKLSYKVSPEAQKALEGLMYWSHVEKLEALEKNPDVHALKNANDCIGLAMDECEKLKVPNWVGNGAMAWAIKNDLRENYAEDFFTKSSYAKKEKQSEIER